MVSYLLGVASNLGYPKAGAVALALLPQFVTAGGRSAIADRPRGVVGSGVRHMILRICLARTPLSPTATGTESRIRSADHDGIRDARAQPRRRAPVTLTQTARSNEVTSSLAMRSASSGRRSRMASSNTSSVSFQQAGCGLPPRRGRGIPRVVGERTHGSHE